MNTGNYPEKKQKTHIRILTRHFKFTHKVEKEFASCAVIEHEKQLVPGLEGHVQANNERMLHVSQHVSLRLGVFDLGAVSGRPGCDSYQFFAAQHLPQKVA